MRPVSRSPEDRLTDHPDHVLVGVLRVPESRRGPAASIGRRVIGALLALSATVLLVYLDRAGYRDANADGLALLACFDYRTASLPTTGSE